ncbi:MFS general substrate transporter [Xylariaceae sp. FL0255]|nr:MFS general substrate transporter [Xylariaceae sp. FL0255]
MAETSLPQDTLGTLEKDGKILSSPAEWSWVEDPTNPYNWRKCKKNVQLLSTALVAFAATIGTSAISPAHQQLVDEFGVSSTVAFLPMAFYVVALGLGPVVGGPLSETAGRRPVFIGAAALGGLLALGAGLTNSFAGLSILRFLGGFVYGPTLAIGSGFLAETYLPAERGVPALLYILSPFLGPGLGPVVGGFIVARVGWRWTNYFLALLSAVSLALVIIGRETYHPVLIRRRMKELGLKPPSRTPTPEILRQFLTVGVLRPLHMMFTEPIVACLCLYVAFVFGVLYEFFGSFFYIFPTVYNFTLEQTGLVFLAVSLGCVLGAVNVALCIRLFYVPQVRRFPPHEVPPEYRLLPAMIGSICLPISMFWFAWTTGSDISPASPIIAIVLFSFGNIGLFVSALQYIGDVYHRTNVASATSANSLARYVLGGVFPLFSLQLYEGLGIGWATSLFGFISLALLPLPWLLFKYGMAIRNRSQYEVASY